ncbi:MAG: ATP-binding cassette domain-containing protein [Chloroflexia bacterium]
MIRQKKAATSSASTEQATSADQPIIIAQDVQKTYDTGKVRVQALRGVSLEIRAGEMVAVMGPSGCGKTTLLNCLSSLDDIDSGRVVIEGRTMESMSDRVRTRLRAERMGFIFQSYNLMPVLSVSENVELPLLVAGMKSREARKRRTKRWRSWGLRTRLSSAPPNSPAASSSGSQSPVRWSTSPPSCGATSRRVRSTPRPPARSWTYCPASTRRTDRPS